MKRCNIDCQFISEFDLFGKEPEFYYKGKPQRTSKFGKILTYSYILIYVAFFIYKIVRMLQKVDITFYESYAFSGLPSIQLTNDLFYGGFSLNGVMDETIYFPITYFYEEYRVNGVMVYDQPKMLELEKCQLNKFGEKYRDIFKDKNLENSYCLKNVNEVTLEGYSHLDSFKYLYVVFLPCVGQNLKGETCSPIADVTQFFSRGAKITFNIQDIELTPHIYDSPSQPLEKDIVGPAFQQLYQQIYTYMQIVNLETDQDVIGFEGLSNVETQQFLKYDESWIISAPSPHASGIQAGMPICEVTIQLSSKVLTQRRKNTKLIEVLGDVGGLMEVIWSFFNIIATLITDILYDKAIVNNLFSFDLDKKIIEIKRNKKNNINENIQLNDNPNIYEPKVQFHNISSSNINNQNDLDVKVKSKFVENSLNTETLMTVKKKKKKKSKQKIIMTSISKNYEMSNHNLEEDNFKIQDDNQMNKQSTKKAYLGVEENNKTKETEKRTIIDKIKINRFCIYFWFCFVRKRKNIQNILLDEGMDLVVENLDIMNIFKKMYIIDKIEKSLKRNDDNKTEMSDTCKQKIQLLIDQKKLVL